MSRNLFIFSIVAVACVSPAASATPREILTNAAFSARSRDQAVTAVAAALTQADAILVRAPADREAQLQQAIAIGYRAKLKKGVADAREARRLMEVLVAADPRNAEARAALAGWHLDAVATVGPFMARTMLGAKKADGIAGLDMAMRLGGNRALFPAMASLTRIQIDKGDIAAARLLAERAVAAQAPTPLDRIMQKNATLILVPLRQGDGRAAQALANRLMPFGRVAG